MLIIAVFVLFLLYSQKMDLTETLETKEKLIIPDLQKAEEFLDKSDFFFFFLFLLLISEGRMSVIGMFVML